MLTPAEAQALLESVLGQFDARLTSPAQVPPGATVVASVLPAVNQLAAIEALNGLVNGGDLTRHVTSGPALVDVPPATSAVAPPGTTPSSPDDIVRAIGTATAPAGTAQGDVSQLLAQLNLSIPRIDIKVQWTVRVPDDAGGYREGVEGSDFVAPTGVNLPTLEMLVVPPIVELTAEAIGATVANLSAEPPSIPLQRWCLFARVTATLGDAPPLARELGPIPLLVAPLPIPTVVALCSRRNFNIVGKSKALIISPPHVASSSLEDLNEVLQTAYTVLGRLRTVGRVAGWLLGVGSVLRLLQATYIAYYGREFINHLDDYPLHTRQWWDDVDINDDVESMVVLGPPGAEVEFYNEKNLRSGEGILIVRIPVTGFVAIPSLFPQDGAPDARPLTVPPDDDTHFILIDDGYENDGDDDGFANSITGIRFRLAEWPSTSLGPLDRVGCPPPPTTDPFPVTRADMKVTGKRDGSTAAMEVTNVGPGAAPGVTLEILGSGAAVGKTTTSQGTVTQLGRGAVRVAIGPMAPKAKVQVTAELKPTHGDFAWSATVSSAAEDPKPDNNTVTEKTIG